MSEKKIENIITLSGEDEDIQVEVIEQTVVDGTTYLLVADVVEGDEDGDCYILKDVSKAESEEADYEVVSDDESEKIFDIFDKMLSKDVDLRKQ